MRHLDEGTLLTMRDGGLVDADARRHATACPSCAAALAEARTRSDYVARALDALSGPMDAPGADDRPIDVEGAKAAVRRRLDGRRSEARQRVPGLFRALGRAAVLLLLASGVVYAIPGSPVRDWADRVRAREAATVPAETAVESEGLELDVPESGLRIAVTSAGPGQTVEVRWTDEARASLVAPRGSRYAVSTDGAEVAASEGVVRIGLPRSGAPVAVRLDGRTILRRVEGRVEVLGSVVSRGPDRIVFSAERP